MQFDTTINDIGNQVTLLHHWTLSLYMGMVMKLKCHIMLMWVMVTWRFMVVVRIGMAFLVMSPIGIDTYRHTWMEFIKKDT